MLLSLSEQFYQNSARSDPTKFVDISDFLLLVLARNASERYDTVPV